MHEEDENDAKDVALILDGDREAFAAIVERHGQAVLRQMRNFTRDPLLMEELAHDVFAEAYVSLGTFRGDAPFRHWLARIATLTGYKFWKRREKEKNILSLSEAPEAAAKPESPGSPAAAELLADLLGTLPPEDRVILTLMYLEKLGQEEIAARMGCTRTMVAVRIYRAKRKLRKMGEREPWKGRLEWMLS